MEQCSKSGSNCQCAITSQAVQSLDELDFIRDDLWSSFYWPQFTRLGIWYAAQTGQLDRIKKLVESGKYQVDSRDSAGYTALHYATRNGHLEVTKYLVEHGAEIDAQTKAGGVTPLHRAACAGHADIAEYLVRKRADVLIKDNDGRNLLDRILNMQENKCALDCLRGIVKISPDLRKLVQERGIDLDSIDLD